MLVAIAVATLWTLIASCATTPACAATIAADNAAESAYADGWQAGDNGGVGFGPWVFDFSGTRTALFHDPQFVDLAPLAENSLGASAFGLTTSDRPTFTDTSTVQRTFGAAISVGDILRLDVDGSALESTSPPFTIGNTIELLGIDGRERFSLFTNNQYHNNNWTATGEKDTGIPAGSAFHIDFALTAPNVYDLAIRPIGGGTPLFTQTSAPLTGTAGAINAVRFTVYGTGSSANGVKELFFNNLTIARDDELAGDHNNDGTVDAADYVTWRNGFGTTYAQGDYDVWRAHFGELANGSTVLWWPVAAVSELPSAVPEPALYEMLPIAAMILVVRRRTHWCAH